MSQARNWRGSLFRRRRSYPGGQPGGAGELSGGGHGQHGNIRGGERAGRRSNNAQHVVLHLRQAASTVIRCAVTVCYHSKVF